jgi:hypothetical protein
MLPLFALAAGIYLGLHFPVLILLPITIFGAGLIALSCWLSGLGLLDGIGAMFWPVIFCQTGYLAGLTGRETYGQVLARLKIGRSKRV